MRQLYLALSATLAWLCLVPQASAQNIQLHYDLGKALYQSQDTRPVLTTTVEMFRPDRWGSTFFFVDMDYKDNSIRTAYWEIARDLRLGKSPLALRLEYNGGLTQSFGFADAYLLGATYAYNAKDFSWGYSLTPTYKHLAKSKHASSLQLTGVWYAHFGQGRYSFNGFADLWKTDGFGSGYTGWTFIAEPQLWVNLNKFPSISPDLNLSIGSEIEISRNFISLDNKLYIIPTLALKWTFK